MREYELVSGGDSLHVRQRTSKYVSDAASCGATSRGRLDSISAPPRRSRVSEHDTDDASDELEEIFGSFASMLAALAGIALALAAVLVIGLGGSVGHLLHR